MSELQYDHPGPRARARLRLFNIVAFTVLALLLYLATVNLIEKGVLSAEAWAPFADGNIQLALLRGLGSTVLCAIYAIILSFILAVILALARLSKHMILRVPATLFIEVVRTLPPLLLILFFFLIMNAELDALGRSMSRLIPISLADALGVRELGRLGAVVLGLTVVHGAMLSEVLRAGIQAVPQGQREAALAIGMTDRQSMRYIVLPQAITTMLPSIISEMIMALKNTALGYIVGYHELLRQGRRIYDYYHNTIPTILVTMAIFITICSALGVIMRKIERRNSSKLPTEAVPA